MSFNIPFAADGGALRLAPDLTYPSDALAGNSFKTVTGLDMQGSLQEALLLTGKFAISYLLVTALTAESNTFKITIDDVVIMNDTFTTGTAQYLIGNASASTTDQVVIKCNKSFLLEIQTATDTDIDINFVARPIL